MKLNFVRKDLLNFINKEIKPLYKTFDKAHNLSHFNFVTNNCVEYSKQLQDKTLNLEMAFVVGALHDIGLKFGRENHSQKSGEMVRTLQKLKQFFNEKEIEIIAQAVEDHSSHLEYEPRNIYGKVVADADRNNSIYLVFSRPIKYGLKYETFRDRQGHINRVYEFANKKFGRNGYVKYWLDIPQTKKEQLALWELLDNEQLCKAYIAGLFDEISKGKVK